MVETIFAPAHANAFEALLNEPLASTFDHPRAEGDLLLDELLVLQCW